MKALVIYNPKSGKGKVLKKIGYIEERLKTKYETDLYAVKKGESIREHIVSLEKQYDLFIPVGGDGTVNAVVSGVCNLSYPAKMAIIPFGTVNDLARNFGYTKNLEKTLDIILNSPNTELHKIYKVNDNYSDYAFAVGVCSGVSFIDSKPLGPLSYYIAGVHQYFHDKTPHVKLFVNGQKYEGNYQLIIVTNSRYVAGYKIKASGKLNILLMNANRFTYPFKLLKMLLFGFKKNIIETDSFEMYLEPGKFNADGEGFTHSGYIKVTLDRTIEFIRK